MNQHSTSEKLPKTARGHKTREKLLRAGEAEFGERGFHAVAISDITRSAGVALGTFYVYFESKEEIFRALVAHMSRTVRSWVAERVADAPDRLTAEREGIKAYLEFVREHTGLYRIISEAQFVANDAFMEHYTVFAKAYQEALAAAAGRGEIRDGDFEVWAWAIMGMDVFLGMRFSEWDDGSKPGSVADDVADLLAYGLSRQTRKK
ncbi:MAG: TetR/AcrR family transcriptional regulator [Xanthomonadales bacterium]|nr:TetR/AcrR family transcriptional regulator [Xanthomonadales bacterium]